MPGTRGFKTGGTTLVKSVGKLGIFPGTLDYLSQFQPCSDFQNFISAGGSPFDRREGHGHGTRRTNVP